MNRRIVVFFCVLFVCVLFPSGLSDLSSEGVVRDIEITLERGMCFGTCPVYSVSLFGNGTITWMGEMYVEAAGNRTDSLDPALVSDLYDRLIEGGFLDLNDSYAYLNITDMPTATLTVRNGTDVKRVYHYHGDFTSPENLTDMEDAVDLVANTSRWIGAGPLDEGTWGEPI